MYDEFECFELMTDGVVYVRPYSIVSYGMDSDRKYPFFITLENGKEYNITEKDYDKFFKENKDGNKL